MQIYNIKEKPEFLKEMVYLTIKEWGFLPKDKGELENKITAKIDKIKSRLHENDYCHLILIEENSLIGFISIFPHDSKERPNLTPWYATMYVKAEYRKKGYSKILNEAILKEAQKRNIKKLYLKTDLKNYYEKFGAKFLEKINENEKIYYFDI